MVSSSGVMMVLSSLCVAYGLIYSGLLYLGCGCITSGLFNVKVSTMMVGTNLEVGGDGWLMVGVVLAVCLVVVVFSGVYMSSDAFYNQFLVILLFFVFGVVVLLVSSGFYYLLIGWEVLGLVSFFLIGYYGSRFSWGSAMVTVMVNRVGDVGMALILLFLLVYGGLFSGGEGVYLSIGLSITVMFVVITKSSQYPCSGWLPLAMAAPTPVSALVHSSTLVIAGLFVGWVLSGSYGVGLKVVGVVIGLVTLMSSSLSVLWECDFKKVVALSTSIHLAIMLMMGFVVSWVFMSMHMGLHAFFKSLLFVGVGLLIMLLLHDQDFRGSSSGGVFSAWCGALIVSSLGSLVGLAFFSGWVTKDCLMEVVMVSDMGWFWFVALFSSLACSFVYAYKLVCSIFSVTPLSGLFSSGWDGGYSLLSVLSMGCCLSVAVGCLTGTGLDASFSVSSFDVSEKLLYYGFGLFVILFWWLCSPGPVSFGNMLFLQDLLRWSFVAVSCLGAMFVSVFESVYFISLERGLSGASYSLGFKGVQALKTFDLWLVMSSLVLGLFLWVAVV
uniref:NADH:ubiquinone reductase (H(+)-translocating) n=1 Tax=Echinorhynchus truttae TaxID=185727 RepID=K0JAI6_9BILA|nr:NADH dehydrogenase subunit 5 [Echinorhynchus truttae]CCA94466.1 NADH dehydrogenase subunit 5 [Echinorhynchus truttae]